jgi:hypothetical protein
LERPAKDEHNNVFGPLISYKEKTFITLFPGSRDIKTFLSSMTGNQNKIAFFP